jgi:hypothetical protein
VEATQKTTRQTVRPNWRMYCTVDSQHSTPLRLVTALQCSLQCLQEPEKSRYRRCEVKLHLNDYTVNQELS